VFFFFILFWGGGGGGGGGARGPEQIGIPMRQKEKNTLL
jgi:hypothetical protein